MAKNKQSNGTVIGGVIAGVLIGAVSTMALSSYRTPATDEPKKEEVAQEQYGVGGGDTLPSSNSNTNKTNEEGKQSEGNNTKEETEGKKDDKKNEENSNASDNTETGGVGGGLVDDRVDFTFASLTQPQVTELNDESTVYEYGDNNVITVLRGDSAFVALNSIVVQQEENVDIDGITARKVEARSLRDGTTESYVIIERGEQVIMAHGSDSFLNLLQTDLTF